MGSYDSKCKWLWNSLSSEGFQMRGETSSPVANEQHLWENHDLDDWERSQFSVWGITNIVHEQTMLIKNKI